MELEIIPVKRNIIGAEARLAEMGCRRYARLAHRATTALFALLRALDLPPGSEVLMPVTLCANPANAVRWTGLRPVFADISKYNFNLDLDAAESVVSPRTKVLLAVPLFGHPLDVQAIMSFAERHGLLVIEDAAQAVGLRHAGREPVGSVGICSIYSFGAGKIAEAGGGAALVSDDLTLLARTQAELARLPSGKRDLGSLASRILAALERLPEELEGRAQLANDYRKELQAPGVTHPQVTFGIPLWKYSVLLPSRDERDRVLQALLAKGVAATNLYPPLSHFFGDGSEGEQARYPVARDVADRIINLPLWPQPPDLKESVAQAFRI